MQDEWNSEYLARVVVSNCCLEDSVFFAASKPPPSKAMAGLAIATGSRNSSNRLMSKGSICHSACPGWSALRVCWTSGHKRQDGIEDDQHHQEHRRQQRRLREELGNHIANPKKHLWDEDTVRSVTMKGCWSASSRWQKFYSIAEQADVLVEAECSWFWSHFLHLCWRPALDISETTRRRNKPPRQGSVPTSLT